MLFEAEQEFIIPESCTSCPYAQYLQEELENAEEVLRQSRDYAVGFMEASELVEMAETDTPLSINSCMGIAMRQEAKFQDDFASKAERLRTDLRSLRVCEGMAEGEVLAPSGARFIVWVCAHPNRVDAHRRNATMRTSEDIIDAYIMAECPNSQVSNEDDR